jgi:predicted nucleic acid-binding protein
MGNRVFIDTNILIYRFDGRDPQKQATAAALLDDDELDIVISSQVLSEFFAVVTRKLKPPMPIDGAIATVEALSELEVLPVTRNLVLDATRTARDLQLSYWDALILESASRAGAAELITEDLSAGSTLRGVTIRNPFR